MKVDPGMAVDGFNSVPLGINSGIPADQLVDGQFSWAQNMTFRNQKPTTRPPFVKRPLKFLNSDGALDGTLRANFQTKIFQGASGFERRNQIVVSIGGRMFRIRPDVWDVLEVTPFVQRLAGPQYFPSNPNLYRAWFCEAENWIIRQDNQSAPWIYDGASSRVSDSMGVNGTKEVPVGNAMVYSQGRIAVALTTGRTFSIGDIVGGPSGTAINDRLDAVLKSVENDLILTGGSFNIPINAGPITSFRPVAQVDTSTGQGPTQIFTDSAIFSLNTPTDRTTWKTVTYPIQTFSVIEAGATSDRATDVVNGDIWMRSSDGVRSFQVARRDFGSWVNSPQSSEVIRALEFDDKSLLAFASSAYFENRRLMTTRPYRNFGHGVVHRGLVVIDFTPVSYLGSSTRPNWEGIWCGLNILQIVSFKINRIARCFIFSLNPQNEIELWELMKDGIEDYDGTRSVPIVSFIETRAFNFQDNAYQMKKLQKAWVWFTDLQGPLTTEVFYKSNQDPAWHPWHNWILAAKKETCNLTGCAVPKNLRPQYRRPYLLPTPENECDDETHTPNNLGEKFQAKFKFTGHVRLDQMIISASAEQEDTTGVCPEDEEERTAEYCETLDFSYSVYT